MILSILAVPPREANIEGLTRLIHVSLRKVLIQNVEGYVIQWIWISSQGFRLARIRAWPHWMFF